MVLFFYLIGHLWHVEVDPLRSFDGTIVGIVLLTLYSKLEICDARNETSVTLKSR